jgi:hypothetical protein
MPTALLVPGINVALILRAKRGRLTKHKWRNAIDVRQTQSPSAAFTMRNP